MTWRISMKFSGKMWLVIILDRVSPSLKKKHFWKKLYDITFVRTQSFVNINLLCTYKNKKCFVEILHWSSESIRVYFYFVLRPDLRGYGNRCFLVALCYLIVRRPTLEVVTKRLLHQHVKIPRSFWCHVCAWKSIPTAISSGVNISEVPGHHLLWQMSSQWGS